MKIKKSNIVLICLAVVFFANTAVNYHIMLKNMKEFSKTRKERVIIPAEN